MSRDDFRDATYDSAERAYARVKVQCESMEKAYAEGDLSITRADLKLARRRVTEANKRRDGLK